MPTAQTVTLDLVADVICPWCYIGRRWLHAALAELAAEGLHITPVWRPFLLYPDAPAGGFAQAAHLLRRFGSAAAADRYHDGVAEAGRAVGLTFRYDHITVTPNTTDAHRLLLAAPPGTQGALADALAHAFFTDGVDLGDRNVLCRLAATAGMDSIAARAVLDSDRYAAEVQSSDQATKQSGIKNVPTFCLHGRILNVPDVEALASVLRSVHRALVVAGP